MESDYAVEIRSEGRGWDGMGGRDGNYVEAPTIITHLVTNGLCILNEQLGCACLSRIITEERRWFMCMCMCLRTTRSTFSFPDISMYIQYILNTFYSSFYSSIDLYVLCITN